LWLAYSFGIKPLVDDANDAWKACSALSTDLGSTDTLPIVGTGLVRELIDIKVNQGVPFAPHIVKDYRTDKTSLVRYKGAVIARPPGIRPILETFGVGFSDIAPAVWEAIPWSFLIDYFVNVGEVLDSARLAFAELGWLQSTVRNSYTVNGSAVRPLKESGLDTTAYGGKSHVSATRVARAPISSFPYPGFHFKVPGVGSMKWCNVAALIAQISGSKPR
jgi:hypothetical protein